MKFTGFLHIFIGCILITFSIDAAHGKRMSCYCDSSSPSSRAKDGEHGAPGYYEDGENGEDGQKGKTGQGGGHGGNGGSRAFMGSSLISCKV